MSDFSLPGLVTIHPTQITIRKHHSLTSHGIRDNLLKTSFRVLVLKLSETGTLLPKHMHVSVAENYTSDILHFLQDEPYPDIESFITADIKGLVSAEIEIPSVSNSERIRLHWIVTFRVDDAYAEQRPDFIHFLTQC